MDNNCVFCDRTKFEERIIAENNDWYVIASLGQITDGGYVLIIPKRHMPCVGAINERETKEIEKIILTTNHAIRAEYSVQPIIFEHGIVGQTIQHAHLHLLPAQIHLNDKIREDFPEVAIDMIVAPNAFEILRHVYALDDSKYLLWSIPVDLWSRIPLVIQIAWNPPAPSQYLRLVVAELLGRQERGNWRNMDPELDKRLWQETVVRLKSHF